MKYLFKIGICLYHVGIYLIPSKYEISGLTRFLLEFFFWCIVCVCKTQLWFVLNTCFGTVSSSIEVKCEWKFIFIAAHQSLCRAFFPSNTSATLLRLYLIPSCTSLIKTLNNTGLRNKILEEGPLVTSCQPDLIPWPFGHNHQPHFYLPKKYTHTLSSHVLLEKAVGNSTSKKHPQPVPDPPKRLFCHRLSGWSGRTCLSETPLDWHVQYMLYI